MARVIERDLALSAKVLQLSNSAFFGIPRKITSLAEAITFLGTGTLKNRAGSVELVDMVHRAHHIACDLNGAELPSGIDREHLGKVGYNEAELRNRISEIRGAFAEHESGGVAHKDQS